MTDPRSGEVAGIEAWIDSQGYPLEMRTAKKLRRCHFPDVVESIEYKDPIEGTLRQSDVLVTTELPSTSGKSPITVSLVFECKQTKGLPWLVLSRPVFGRGAQAALLPRLTGGPRYYLPEALSERAFEGESARGWYLDTFGQPKIVGFRAIEVPLRKVDSERSRERGKTPKDPAYDAIRQVLAASEARSRASSGRGAAEVVVPVIVIDGSLYSSQLMGERVRARLTDGLAAVIHRLPSRPDGPGVPILIVTYKALSKFALRFYRGLSELHREVDEITRRMNELGNRSVTQSIR